MHRCVFAADASFCVFAADASFFAFAANVNALRALLICYMVANVDRCPTLMHAFKLGGRKIPKKWATVMGPHRNKKVITRMHNSAEYNAWLDGCVLCNVCERVAANSIAHTHVCACEWMSSRVRRYNTTHPLIYADVRNSQ